MTVPALGPLSVSGFTHTWFFLYLLVILALVGLSDGDGGRRRACGLPRRWSCSNALPPSGGRSAPARGPAVGRAALLTTAMPAPPLICVSRANRAVVMLVIDVSESMVATDVAPSRIVAARQAGKHDLEQQTEPERGERNPCHRQRRRRPIEPAPRRTADATRSPHRDFPPPPRSTTPTSSRVAGTRSATREAPAGRPRSCSPSRRGRTTSHANTVPRAADRGRARAGAARCLRAARSGWRGRASGPPGAAWINRKTSADTMSSSGSAWATGRGEIAPPHSFSAASISHSCTFQKIPVLVGFPLKLRARPERRRASYVVQRDLRHGLRDDRCASRSSRLRVRRDRRSGRTRRGARERVVLEVVDVPSGRRRAIGGEKRGDLRVGRHLPPVQHRVESPLEPDRADRRAVLELDPDVDADVAQLLFDGLRDVFADGVAGLRDQRERERAAVPLRGCRRARRVQPASSSRRARLPDRNRYTA